MTEHDEAECLRADPFQGDFGAPGDRILKNKMGTARKVGNCNDCAQPIVPGERVRLLSAVFDGSLMSYRWCALCCAAMSKSEHDDGEAWEARIEMGRVTAGKTTPAIADQPPAAAVQVK